ncbi:hypothetical protein [Natronobiforma cellulositropha]|uniref:hypothetical protein n=1 Tax=Natronobiforma cellulositropha TaxID=1679076 RepID=UPI0021D57E73|nr:hypothetical protein [Natronobiforma cellulositropha]
MQEVEVSYVIEGAVSDVDAELSPERIVEYTGVYELESTERVGETTVARVWLNEVETELEFRCDDRYYAFEQRGTDGVFSEMGTWITLEEVSETGDGAATRVTARSAFTFGSRLSVLIDRLAIGSRRRELERILDNLAVAVTEDGQ